MIDAKTQLYGLIGCPIGHSKSPAMHNLAFKHLGINAVYLCFEVKPEQLKYVTKAMKALNIVGLNVTVPYKEAIINYLDEITEIAKKVGAVNTIFRRGAKLIGTNTDIEGFIRDLRDSCRFSAKNKVVLVIGAGGASKAVCFGLADAGARQIFILDIDKRKSFSLARKLKRNYQGLQVKAIEHNEVPVISEAVDLLVNATPVGMKKNDPRLIDLTLFSKKLLVYDLIYNPPMTDLLLQAKSCGIRYANGAGMLLRQATIAFKHWTKQDPPVEVMEMALKDFIVVQC